MTSDRQCPGGRRLRPLSRHGSKPRRLRGPTTCRSPISLGGGREDVATRMTSVISATQRRTLADRLGEQRVGGVEIVVRLVSPCRRAPSEKRLRRNCSALAASTPAASDRAARGHEAMQDDPHADQLHQRSTAPDRQHPPNDCAACPGSDRPRRPIQEAAIGVPGCLHAVVLRQPDIESDHRRPARAERDRYGETRIADQRNMNSQPK